VGDDGKIADVLTLSHGRLGNVGRSPDGVDANCCHPCGTEKARMVSVTGYGLKSRQLT